MTENVKKVCPECGGGVVGRSDKIYCSDECRIMAANRRGRHARGEIAAIHRDLLVLGGKGGGKYIKFIQSVIKFCKILYKFGH